MHKLLIFSLFICINYANFAQTIPLKTVDTLGMHPTIRDANKNILAWYKPLQPGAAYAEVSRLASEFIKNSVPIDPTTGLKQYLITCCFAGPHLNSEAAFKAGKTGENWPQNSACVYAGMVQSLVLDYRVFSGDQSYVKIVKEMLEHQLDYGTTPADFVWANVPYASSNPFEKNYTGATKWENDGMRGDGLHGIEPDKVGELGYGYLKFYQVTGERKYLDAAINCANALAKNINKSPLNEKDSFYETNKVKSPWPFRLNGRTGVVHQEYCANVIEPIKLFDEIIRTKKLLNLDDSHLEAIQKARNYAWDWLYSKYGPMKTGIWNGYFEDVQNDAMAINRVNNIPIETARYLLQNPSFDKNIEITVPALLSYVENAFGTEEFPAIKEQIWCYVPMGSHSARFASVCALWYERSKDENYKTKAKRYFDVATYCTDLNGVVRVGPTWPSSWYSDGYSDYIKHFIQGLASVPDWTQNDAVLRSRSVVQNIDYQANKIVLSTYDNVGEILVRLMKKPTKITFSGKQINEKAGWTWQPLAKGGVLNISHLGNNIEVFK